MSADPPRAEILGVGVSAVDMDAAVAEVEGWISSGRRSYVCVTSVHGVMECQSSPLLRAIHRGAGLVVPDGKPLVWMARMLGFKKTRQVFGPDLMRRLTELSPARGYRHFYYGGAPGVAEELSDKLRRSFPGLQVVGTYCPPFRPLTPEEDAAVIRQINAARPDIVWVGLSTPKQEKWMHDHAPLLDAPALVGVGAAFDFLSGRKRQAPLWMQRSALQWLFRLATEPRRLWRRYLWIVPGFLWRAGLQLASHRVALRVPR
ncbi:WecB/TagA/CpsF family glycosyltransferase [Enterovirga sp. DB1703]|uniref:WecB/TagA/CpsF family glycosyltransferase n=1 Tax=Enterovirga aerilata TaxID=2730920 RepID=A0A849IJF4_9HYPH|nr:WecB/TagA/CpsF family glycosyltransferase [Enterovirga sp. DB1703]